VEVRAEHVEAAKETIILERRLHVDSLVARLRGGACKSTSWSDKLFMWQKRREGKLLRVVGC